ncbi:MAG: FAD-dependent oxidoreductase [Armatimonadota bacterium]|nr:FAD-dependent oxidoreductase [Armatimonadota bacterium]
MAQRAVVIGGGAIGAAAAYFLAADGWDVTLVERGQVGRGCSYGNACLIVPSHAHPLPQPGVVGEALRWLLHPAGPVYIRPRFDRHLVAWLWRFWRACTPAAAARAHDALVALGRFSLAQYEDLARTVACSVFFQRRGLLHVYLGPRAAEHARAEQARYAADGFPGRVLLRDELLAFEPALSPRVGAGLYLEGEAHGDSFAFTRALAEAATARGARVVTGRTAARISTRDGRVTGVRVDGARNEDVPADVVVLAAGAWSPGLAATLGLRIPMQPAKGYSCTVRPRGLAPSVPLYVIGRRVAITPLGDRLRFGGTLELAGYDERIDPRRYRAVVAAAREVLRDDLAWDHEEAWCGLRPLLPDGLPLIGRVPWVDGAIVATGHAMLGFTLAAGTGRVVADLAAGRPPAVPLEAFAVDRFGRA